MAKGFAEDMGSTAEAVASSLGVCTECGGDRDPEMLKRSDAYPCDCEPPSEYKRIRGRALHEYGFGPMACREVESLTAQGMWVEMGGQLCFMPITMLKRVVEAIEGLSR